MHVFFCLSSRAISVEEIDVNNDHEPKYYELFSVIKYSRQSQRLTVVVITVKKTCDLLTVFVKHWFYLESHILRYLHLETAAQWLNRLAVFYGL